MSLPSTTDREPPDQLHCLGKQDLPGYEELTDSTLSLSNKVFPSINDFSAGDLLAPQLLGQQQVLLQDAHHEQLSDHSATSKT